MPDKIYLTAEDISELLQVSRSKAYKIIREMNTVLEAKGYLIISGKVPTAYFKEHWYGLATT